MNPNPRTFEHNDRRLFMDTRVENNVHKQSQVLEIRINKIFSKCQFFMRDTPFIQVSRKVNK